MSEDKTETQTAQKTRPTWKVVLAAILDFITIFVGGGYIIASAFGGKSESGFSLQGGPAFLLFALVVLYFVIFNRYLGGTIWKRIFQIN